LEKFLTVIDENDVPVVKVRHNLLSPRLFHGNPDH
jgi:hypothetical protein